MGQKESVLIPPPDLDSPSASGELLPLPSSITDGLPGPSLDQIGAMLSQAGDAKSRLEVLCRGLDLLPGMIGKAVSVADHSEAKNHARFSPKTFPKLAGDLVDAIAVVLRRHIAQEKENIKAIFQGTFDPPVAPEPTPQVPSEPLPSEPSPVPSVPPQAAPQDLPPAVQVPTIESHRDSAAAEPVEAVLLSETNPTQ